MSDKTLGFVALTSLKRGRAEPAQALAEIRRIYFKTTRKTIEHDLAHAIELLTSLPTDEDRDRAAVYMDGLSQMRSEWSAVDRTDGSKTTRQPKARRKR